MRAERGNARARRGSLMDPDGMRATKREKDEILDYAERQAGEPVVHLGKVASELVAAVREQGVEF